MAGAAALLTLVSHLAANPADAASVLGHLALHELALLEKAAVIYRIPPRLSTIVVVGLLDRWLGADQGGRRHEGASVALLRFAGDQLSHGWNHVESHHVNDPTPYDALCLQDGVRVVAEVKVQTITIDQLRQLGVQMDEHSARRGYLLTRTAWLPAQGTADANVISSFLRSHDALGRRIDLIDVLEAAKLWLPLLDQDDQTLPMFVRLLADELDRHALADDRRSLARLLDEL